VGCLLGYGLGANVIVVVIVASALVSVVVTLIASAWP